MKKEQPGMPPEFMYDYYDPDAAFDSMLEELDQIDLLDEDVQRLTRRSFLLKCMTVALVAALALLNRHAPVWLAAVLIGAAASCWVLDAFWLRRRRLEAKLQKDILKGAPLATDLRIETLQELYPEGAMHYPECFFSREIFGFYSPFLGMSLLLAAFSFAQTLN